MSEITFRHNKKRSEYSDMTFTAEAVRDEMQNHVRSVAELARDDGRKAALQFVASFFKLPYGRIRSLYYGEARRIDAHEADKIRAYVKQAETLIQARQDYENRRAEFLKTASPFMARLVPPSLPSVEVPEGITATATDRGAR